MRACNSHNTIVKCHFDLSLRSVAHSQMHTYIYPRGKGIKLIKNKTEMGKIKIKKIRRILTLCFSHYLRYVKRCSDEYVRAQAQK